MKITRVNKSEHSMLSPPRRPPSLRRSLIALLGGALALALLLMGMSVFRFISRTEEQAWRGRQEEASRRGAEKVGVFLQRATDFLALVGALDRAALAVEPEVVDELLYQFPAVLDVVRLDSSGEVLADAHREVAVLSNLFTIPQANWFHQAAQGKTYLGDLQISAGEEPYLIIAVPAEDGGVVVGRLRMRVLWDMVPDIGFGQTGRAYVVNSEGEIVAHTDAQVPVARVSIAGRPEMEGLSNAPGNRWYGAYVNFEGYEVVGVTAQVPGTRHLLLAALPCSC